MASNKIIVGSGKNLSIQTSHIGPKHNSKKRRYLRSIRTRSGIPLHISTGQKGGTNPANFPKIQKKTTIPGRRGPEYIR